MFDASVKKKAVRDMQESLDEVHKIVKDEMIPVIEEWCDKQLSPQSVAELLVPVLQEVATKRLWYREPWSQAVFIAIVFRVTPRPLADAIAVSWAKIMHANHSQFERDRQRDRQRAACSAEEFGESFDAMYKSTRRFLSEDD